MKARGSKNPTDADSAAREAAGIRGERPSSQFPETNPFSTRFTAPGKIPFFFERSFLRRMKAARPAKFEEFFVRALGAGEDIRSSVCLQFLIDKFETNARRGQLVGPHGSGKSTLLFSLKEALTKRGYEIFTWTLHDQRRFLPDVFWLELQRFLQSAPAFLPVKCLLPPPVVSREEYWARRRKFQAESGENGAAVDEFNVGAANGSDFSVKSDFPAPGPTSDTRRADGFFGFNAAGNFGFNALGEKRGATASENVNFASESVPFAPFPGVAPPNENETENERVFGADNATATNETVVAPSDLDAENLNASSENAPPAPPRRSFFQSLKPESQNAPNEPFVQKKLEMPLPLGFDLEKSRSLFEKKVVFFDGFEQLSYVNRIILRTFCRMNRLGLLLTTHSPAIGVPVLFRTTPSVETLRQTLNYLLDDLDMTPEDADLEILIKNFNGDVREIIFSLYDAFENYRWAPREYRDKIERRYPR